MVEGLPPWRYLDLHIDTLIVGLWEFEQGRMAGCGALSGCGSDHALQPTRQGFCGDFSRTLFMQQQSMPSNKRRRSCVSNLTGATFFYDGRTSVYLLGLCGR